MTELMRYTEEMTQADLSVLSGLVVANSFQWREEWEGCDFSDLVAYVDGLLETLAVYQRDDTVTQALQVMALKVIDSAFSLWVQLDGWDEDKIMEYLEHLRASGQNEYAGKGQSPFANFNRVADWIGIDRDQALMVYALKHVDGIRAYYVDGHTSQREDVSGRLGDLVVYMILFFGMTMEDLGLTKNIGAMAALTNRIEA